MRFLSVCRLIGVCLLVAAVWQVQAWRYAAQIERLSVIQAQAALHQRQVEQDQRLALEQQLTASDTQHAQELSDAQRHQAALRDRLATADVRLSVLLDASSGCAVPAATGAGSVVHAAPRARLDPAHA
ncbi:lysis protein, partial [Pseudomonas cedrina subsp. fulgida]|nr:lysis protein [Pseudomonas cedrina subsp. fulgida]